MVVGVVHFDRIISTVTAALHSHDTDLRLHRCVTAVMLKRQWPLYVEAAECIIDFWKVTVSYFAELLRG